MSGKDKNRDERLAAALRDNLGRRKAQARQLDRSGDGPAEDSDEDREDKS